MASSERDTVPTEPTSTEALRLWAEIAQVRARKSRQARFSQARDTPRDARVQQEERRQP